jgi:predicted SprT family Zn-dependent metalloprotease
MARWFQQLEFRWGTRRRTDRSDSRPASDEDLTAWCRERVRAFGLTRLARKVEVFWNPRLRSTAGRAWWPDRTIELNPRLRELGDDELWRTVRHELAHLMAYERAGRRKVRAHGPEWRAACADLGIAGESPYHELPLRSHRQRRKFSYTCPVCFESFERVRRMRGAAACYACCRQHSGGRFDQRFRLVERKL